MKKIIILSLGPVQTYISQARRTHDLFQGSRILSYLASAGLDYARNQQQAEIIYPRLAPGSKANIPNRIVAVWHDENGAEKFASGMENAIRQALDTISSSTRDYFIKGLKTEAPQKIRNQWDEQIASWLEIYWVIGDYTETKGLKEATAALGARKLLRNFSQITEFGLKDSITGEQAVLHDEKGQVEFWRDWKKSQGNRALIGNSERLGAISSLKRFAHEELRENGSWKPINPDLHIEYRYPSTSSIAVAPFKYALLRQLLNGETDNTKLLQALKKFIEALLEIYKNEVSSSPANALFFSRRDNFNPEYFPKINNLPGLNLVEAGVTGDGNFWKHQLLCLDGDYFFEDALTKKTIAEYLPLLDKQTEADSRSKRLKPKLAKALKALQELKQAAKALGIPAPQPYLAILSMDGDSMGKTVSNLSHEALGQFSETLADFATSTVKQLVEEEHLGRLVYAGGDDVLALVAVSDALPLAETLRQAFESQIAALGIKNVEGEAVTVTASTGLAFVHYNHDLQTAVSSANTVQSSIAKEKCERNALAVSLLRRSGEARSMGNRWLEKGIALVPLIENLRLGFFHEAIGRSLPYDIAQIAYQMDESHQMKNARRSEIRRIMKRRFTKRGEEQARLLGNALGISPLTIRDKKDLDKLNEKILEAFTENLLSLLEIVPNLADVQHWLELARFIAQKESE